MTFISVDNKSDQKYDKKEESQSVTQQLSKKEDDASKAELFNQFSGSNLYN